MRNTSAKSVSQSAALLFLLLSLFVPMTSFSQDRDLSETGLLRKQQAISKLGNRLATVAAKHGKTPSQLRRMFLEDHSLHLDQNDKLLYIDRAPNEAELAKAKQEEELSAPQAPPYPLSQTFTLNSRPGSRRVIYLDFDGHTIDAGNHWYSYMANYGGVAQPFDIDNNPAFNDLELEVIQAVWQRIAEDFAAFDVNVTTQYPGDDALSRGDYSDQTYGTRAVFTKTNFMGAGIGGVAYVGTFDFAGNDPYLPAWIFTAGMGSDKTIVEAASHEIGHNLGLNHDGTASQGYYGGHGVYGPIMGVAYSRSVSQWDKGEYFGSNNPEDDLVVMQSHGLLPIADDHGNTTGTARVLNGTSISASGLITTSTDVDVFKFTTGSGNVSININPAPRGANLDIKAELLDSAGNLIATSNPSSYALMNSFPAGMAASFNQFLSAGTYYLRIDGTGNPEGDGGGYTDYGSLGQYFINGTLASGGGGSSQSPVAVITPSTTSGTAPLSVNFYSTGSYDPDGSIASYAWNFGDGTVSSSQNPTKVYNSAGTFTASLTVTDNSGLTGTNSVTINVSPATVSSSISGTVFYGNTPAGQGVKYVSGVQMLANGSSTSSANSWTNGSYSLGNLVSGGYYVVTPTKTGNINGITAFDATLVLRHVASGGMLSGNQLISADTDNSGDITAFDATQILRFTAAGFQSTTTGQVGNWKFTPGPQSYGPVSGALTNQNYEAFLVGEVDGDWSATAGIIFGDENEEQVKIERQKRETAGLFTAENALFVPKQSVKTDVYFQTKVVQQQPESQVQILLPQNATGQNGSTVLIPISLTNNNTPIGAYTIEVNYDPSVLQPLANPVNTNGTLSDGSCAIVSNVSGTGIRSTVRVAGACPTSINNSGTLLNLRFNVIGTANTATGTTTLEFTLRTGSNPIPYFQNDSGVIPVTAVNGSFSVISNIPNASVTLAGRVLTANGQGLRNAQVQLTNADGSSKIVVSGPFGYYRFANVLAGQQVTIQVFSKRFGFQPQTVNISGDVSDLNFIAQP
ncbi:MAG: PKD domain-containing protein [Acidobacteriota bacterium]|nr:PKD domain-containing protein [Acidobacteriota bacterium]